MRKFMILEPINQVSKGNSKTVWTQNNSESLNDILGKLMNLKDHNTELFTSAYTHINALIHNYNKLGKQEKPKNPKQSDKSFHINDDKESVDIQEIGKQTRNQVKHVKTLKQRFAIIQKKHSEMVEKYTDNTIEQPNDIIDCDIVDNIELDEASQEILKDNDRQHNIDNANKMYKQLRDSHIHFQGMRNLKFTNSNDFTITHIITDETKRNNLVEMYKKDTSILLRACHPKYVKLEGKLYYIIRTKKA